MRAPKAGTCIDSGVLHYELGTGGYSEAAQRAREAVEILGGAGDLRGRGHALRLLGRATRARGNLADAERLLMEAEALLAEHGHGDDVAIVRASRADLLRLSGRLEQASSVYEEVLDMGLEDPVTEANVRKDLGEIALARDDLAAAQASFEAAEAPGHAGRRARDRGPLSAGPGARRAAPRPRRRARRTWPRRPPICSSAWATSTERTRRARSPCRHNASTTRPQPSTNRA